MSHVLFDPETGEIIGQPKVKSERFQKQMREVWRHVYEKGLFTAAEERILSRLANYLQLNTNAIVTPGGEYMGIEDMARYLYMDRAHVRRRIKSLIRKNAIGVWRSGDYEIYYINPVLYRCGNVDPYLWLLFDREYHERARKENVKCFRAGKKYTNLIVAV
mgnify:CR=1 FL=1